VLAAHTAVVSALAYQRQGPHLVSGGADGLIGLWRPDRGRHPMARIELEGEVSALAWSSDDRRLAIGTDRGAVQLWELRPIGTA
jgi:WD40 repeat protein